MAGHRGTVGPSADGNAGHNVVSRRLLTTGAHRGFLPHNLRTAATEMVSALKTSKIRPSAICSTAVSGGD